MSTIFPFSPIPDDQLVLSRDAVEHLNSAIEVAARFEQLEPYLQDMVKYRKPWRRRRGGSAGPPVTNTFFARIDGSTPDTMLPNLWHYTFTQVTFGDYFEDPENPTYPPLNGWHTLLDENFDPQLQGDADNLCETDTANPAVWHGSGWKLPFDPNFQLEPIPDGARVRMTRETYMTLVDPGGGGESELVTSYWFERPNMPSGNCP